MYGASAHALGENHSIALSPVVKYQKFYSFDAKICSDIGPCALFVPRSKQLFLKVVSFEENNSVEGQKRKNFLLAVPDVTFDYTIPRKKKVVS